MKQKKHLKKLSLKRQTVTNLDGRAMSNVVGGRSSVYVQCLDPGDGGGGGSANCTNFEGCATGFTDCTCEFTIGC